MDNIIVAIIGYLVTLISTIAVIKTEIKNLTKRVDKHNNVIERTYQLESEVKIIKEKIKTQDKIISKTIRNRNDKK